MQLQIASEAERVSVFGHKETSWADKVELSRKIFNPDPNDFYNLERVTEDNNPRLYGILKDIANELDEPMPALYVFDGISKRTNSSAVAFKQDYRICLSRLLAEGLDDDDLKGTLTHEFSHFFDENIESYAHRRLNKMKEREDNGPAEKVLLKVATIASELLFCRRLRENEFNADGLATYLTNADNGKHLKNSVAIGGKEWKKLMKEANEKGEENSVKQTGLKNNRFLSKFSYAHPRHEQRLEAMQKMTYVERSLQRFDREENDREK
jgi:Zn-dependent protease with chaperone function